LQSASASRVFAYALVLPDMRADFGWTYTDAGCMNATNAAGYLLGAMITARAITAIGAYRVMVTRVLASGVAQSNAERAAFLLGLFYAGPGVGILLAGLAIPVTLERLGPGSRSMAWAALAVLSRPMAFALRFAHRENVATRTSKQPSSGLRNIGSLLGVYLLFGAGYITYMTFMIAWVQSNDGGVHFPDPLLDRDRTCGDGIALDVGSRPQAARAWLCFCCPHRRHRHRLELLWFSGERFGSYSASLSN
jgi:hypothetical protein